MLSHHIWLKSLNIKARFWQFIDYLSTQDMFNVLIMYISAFSVWEPSVTHLLVSPFFLLCCADSHYSLSCLAINIDDHAITHLSLMVQCWLIISDLLSHWLTLHLLLPSCFPQYTCISWWTAQFCREMRYKIIYLPGKWGYFMYGITREVKHSLWYPAGKWSLSCVLYYTIICGRSWMFVYTPIIGIYVPQLWTESRITLELLGKCRVISLMIKPKLSLNGTDPLQELWPMCVFCVTIYIHVYYLKFTMVWWTFHVILSWLSCITTSFDIILNFTKVWWTFHALYCHAWPVYNQGVMLLQILPRCHRHAIPYFPMPDQ